MANEHKKKYSISLAVRKIENKTIMRYRYIPIRIGKKKYDNTKWLRMQSNWNFHTLLVEMQKKKIYTATLKKFGRVFLLFKLNMHIPLTHQSQYWVFTLDK